MKKFDPRLGFKDACPKCGHEIDAATHHSMDEAVRPTPGDISVCIQCANLLIFKDDMRVRTLSLDELEELDPVIQKEVLLTRARVLLLHDMEKKGLI